MPGLGRRRGTRIKTAFKSIYSAAREEGSATLAEISYSGARLQNTGLRPAPDTRVSVYVWLPNQSEPFELVGRVVRHTEDGFAIEYEDPGQNTCHLVDAASALLAGSNGERAEPKAEVSPNMSLSDLDLSAYSLPELQELVSRLEKAIEGKREETRDRLREEMARLASREGLTLDEVMAGARARESD
jgi:hypothetical protein